MRKLKFFTKNWLVFKVENQQILKRLHLINGTVIDLGCGEKPYRSLIESKTSRYFGIDWDQTYHKWNMDVVGSLNQPFPIKCSSVDTVVSFAVLEHICEPSNFITESFRILRDDGIVIFTVPFMWWVHESPYDYFRYTRHGLEYLFLKSGFADIQIEENTGFWQMWVLKLNYHLDRIIKKPLRIFLPLLWFFDQHAASLLDRINSNPFETASYTVVARKKTGQSVQS